MGDHYYYKRLFLHLDQNTESNQLRCLRSLKANYCVVHVKRHLLQLKNECMILENGAKSRRGWSEGWKGEDWSCLAGVHGAITAVLHLEKEASSQGIRTEQRGCRVESWPEGSRDANPGSLSPPRPGWNETHTLPHLGLSPQGTWLVRPLGWLQIVPTPSPHQAPWASPSSRPPRTSCIRTRAPGSWWA